MVYNFFVKYYIFVIFGVKLDSVFGLANGLINMSSVVVF